MIIVDCQALRANSPYRAEERFIYYIDGNATSVKRYSDRFCSVSNQTKVPVVCDRKTEMYSILFGPPVQKAQNSCHFKGVQRTEQQRLFLKRSN